jgi:hypothetical protein
LFCNEAMVGDWIHVKIISNIKLNLCVSAIEIQTFGPISIEYGSVENHDPQMVCMYVRQNLASGWPPEAGKPLMAKPCSLQKIS